MIPRRAFLASTGLAGVAGWLGVGPAPAGAEPPPEVTTIRMIASPITCIAPQYAAAELLKAEGFTDVRYVPVGQPNDALVAGEVDLALAFVPMQLARIDTGAPLVMLAGIHAGCVELVGGGAVKSTRDLKGRRVAVFERHGDQEIFISMFVAHVGLDPRRDIEWVVHSLDESDRLLAERRIDAFMALPPSSLALRARRIGRVLVDTAKDKPWSQYFCCVLTSTRDFVRRHPIATKRALRALLKGVDLCAREPERAARAVASRGVASYAQALQTIRGLPYAGWRQLDPEDSLRFFALRLHEAGLIRSSPPKLIAQGADWRILRELRRELKG